MEQSYTDTRSTAAYSLGGLCYPVRAEFSQAFLRAQRETIRACARAGLQEQEEEVGEEEEEADHVCTRARAGRSSNSRNFI